MNFELLLKVKRANLIEKEHFGYIIVVDKNEKILSQIGEDNSIPFFLRSCVKPIQALPVLTSGAFSRFNLNLKELAVCCSSHTASKEHIETITSILNKLGLSEKSLQCGVHNPIDVDTNNYLIRHNLQPSSIHNNCSGKHAGMLTVCMNNNWDISNYLDFDHPLQIEILNTIQKYCNIDGNVEKSLDGCSAPVYAIPLYKMGAGFLKLFLSQEAALIRQAFAENPHLIGGKGRLDSSIIEATGGKLVAKIGADGLCIVSNLQEEKSLVVKILDAEQSARSAVTIQALKQLGWLTKEELANENIRKLDNLTLKNHKNITVGEIQPAFKI